MGGPGAGNIVPIWCGIGIFCPYPPTGIQASTSCKGTNPQVVVTWTPSISVGVSQYKIYRNSLLIGTSTGTSLADTTPAANTSYTYAVSTKLTQPDGNGPESNLALANIITTQNCSGIIIIASGNISSHLIIPNNTDTYTITENVNYTAGASNISDVEGFLDIGGPYRGQFAWSLGSNFQFWPAGSATSIIPCTNGGSAGIYSGVPNYITITFCQTQIISATTRQVQFNVKFNTTYTNPASGNTLSAWAAISAGTNTGWVPVDTFDLALPPSITEYFTSCTGNPPAPYNHLAWTATNGATAYNIYRTNVPGQPPAQYSYIATLGNQTSVDDVGQWPLAGPIKTNTSYSYIVQASTAVGYTTSAPSNTITTGWCDNTPPTAGFQSPIANCFTPGGSNAWQNIQPINAIASDSGSGVASVTYRLTRLNGNPLLLFRSFSAQSSGTPNVWFYAFTNADLGTTGNQFQLEVQAQDQAGNVSGYNPASNPFYYLDNCNASFLQTTSGDVHSNTKIFTPGGP